MTTALDLITGAAKIIGVVFKSEALSADEASDGLTALNDMLDSWSNDDLITFAPTLESFAMTGASSYTIGSGGTLNTTRPINIITAVVRSGTVDYPLEILTPEQYQTEVPVKNINTQIPKYLTYDNGYPLGTIKMFAIPLSGTTLYLQTNKPLSNLSALTTTVDLPPGWKKAIKYNLAIDLAPQYGAQITPQILDQAKKSLGAIKRATSANTGMPYTPATIQYYSILTGTP